MASVSSAAQGMARTIDGDVILTWSDFKKECIEFAMRINVSRGPKPPRFTGIFGIPTGGCFVAQELASILKLKLLDKPQTSCLVVDDVIATGRTMQEYAGFPLAALYSKPGIDTADHLFSQSIGVTGWIKFPWEHSGAPEDAVVRLLEYAGQDPNSEGIRETPRRYLKALKELTSGYGVDVKEILSKTFEERFNEMVVVSDVPFFSLCEHHLLPFHGTVSVGYLPKEAGVVVGLSKLTRVIQAYARRLQVQERMTKEITMAIHTHLKPAGAGCVVRAKHLCMEMRGARSPGMTTTSYLIGEFRRSAEVRSEFLSFAGARP